MRQFILIFLLAFPASHAVAQGSWAGVIVIDLDGKNFSGAFTDVSHGVTFGWLHAGEPIEMAWTEPGRNIGFLVLNRYGNQPPDGTDENVNNHLWFQVRDQWKKQAASGGLPVEEPVSFHVASGREMFGNFTNQPLSQKEGEESKAVAARGESWEPNGFRALGYFDRKENGGNENGMIDGGDRVFSHLRVWVDTAHNGRSEDGKMYTLTELGIRFITLSSSAGNWTDGNGNRLGNMGQIGLDDTNRATPQIGEVHFHTSPPAQ